jgi:hypothetical protein
MTLRHFDRSLGCLISPTLDELATQLSFIAYQLLRAHPEHDLPSILIPCGGVGNYDQFKYQH